MNYVADNNCVRGRSGIMAISLHHFEFGFCYRYCARCSNYDVKEGEIVPTVSSMRKHSENEFFLHCKQQLSVYKSVVTFDKDIVFHLVAS